MYIQSELCAMVEEGTVTLLLLVKVRKPGLSAHFSPNQYPAKTKPRQAYLCGQQK